MGSRYVLLVRLRGGTQKTRYASAAEALDALEHESRAVATVVRPRTARALGREYEPARQVALRAEIRGPRGLRAGLDVHGDGSAEAFTGRLSRTPVEPLAGEDAWRALRRVVGAQG